MAAERVLLDPHQSEQKSAVVENDTCASSLPETTVRRTISRTTYIANLHFKEQGYITYPAE